jgi:glycosyltransferase involved in cell wall biosynthesis
LSIITPNYNYSKYIGFLIESIIRQDYENLEYIIVDDGSTDNSVEIIEKYVDRYPRIIKLIKQSNKGQTIAINNALKAVTGDVIGWINSDDLYAPNVFNKIVSFFNTDNSIDALFGNIEIINENGVTIKINKYLPFDYSSGVFNGFGKIISSNAIFWRTRLTDETGLMKENFIYAMDSEYWSRLLYNRNVKHINFVFSKFRWHDLAKTVVRRNKKSNAFEKSRAEDNFVFVNSYKNLLISRLIPVKFSIPFKLFYKLKRYFLRLIYGHYLNA